MKRLWNKLKGKISSLIQRKRKKADIKDLYDIIMENYEELSKILNLKDPNQIIKKILEQYKKEQFENNKDYINIRPSNRIGIFREITEICKELIEKNKAKNTITKKGYTINKTNNLKRIKVSKNITNKKKYRINNYNYRFDINNIQRTLKSQNRVINNNITYNKPSMNKVKVLTKRR